MLDNTPNQLPKFTTKNLVQIYDDSRGTYNTNSQIEFETSVLKSSFVIKVMYTYLRMELCQLKTPEEQVMLQILMINK